MSSPSGPKNWDRKPKNPRLVPFLVLVGVVAAFGILFFQVIYPLILPLFLASVVAMLAHPLHRRMTAWLRGYEYVAAGVVTVLILLAVIGPLATASYLAVKQLSKAVTSAQSDLADGGTSPWLDPDTNPTLARGVAWVEHVSPVPIDDLRGWGVEVATTLGQTLLKRTTSILGDVVWFVLGTFTFVISLYFFLVDGPRIIQAWEDLTPLDSEHDRIIRTEFSKVCRAVVLATLVAAVAQGLLFGIGAGVLELFTHTGLWQWIFLLALLTTMFSLIPMLGAAAIWAPTGLYLIFSGHTVAGIVLIVYGATVVSTVDNVLKILVIKDSANLHPLLVLVCVFGGIRLVGILGVFVGPIIGAVLFSLMRILKRELSNMPGSEERLAAPADATEERSKDEDQTSTVAEQKTGDTHGEEKAPAPKTVRRSRKRRRRPRKNRQAAKKDS